jgi:hypothetical protein
MPGIDYRKICWPNPDATCLEGGCGYCMDGVWRSINTIRRYAEEASKTGDGTLANRGIGRTPAMEAFLYGATLPGRVNNNIKWRIR